MPFNRSVKDYDLIAISLKSSTVKWLSCFCPWKLNYHQFQTLINWFSVTNFWQLIRFCYLNLYTSYWGILLIFRILSRKAFKQSQSNFWKTSCALVFWNEQNVLWLNYLLRRLKSGFKLDKFWLWYRYTHWKMNMMLWKRLTTILQRNRCANVRIFLCRCWLANFRNG